jgi:hypothetical protein
VDGESRSEAVRFVGARRSKTATLRCVSTCRDEVLAAAQALLRLGQVDFSPDDIIREMERMGTRYAPSTIRTHVVSRMCVNAPAHHQSRYEDLERIGRARYRLMT